MRVKGRGEKTNMLLSKAEVTLSVLSSENFVTVSYKEPIGCGGALVVFPGGFTGKEPACRCRKT